MVLEATMICVDNSDFMRNGDFVPTRLQAQQDAVGLVANSKRQGNPENTVGLMTLGHVEVLMTTCADIGRLLSKLHQVQPKGEMHFTTGIRVAHLALRHRQSRNQKMRIVAFIGSPIGEDEKDLVRLAKRLKKEKVNVDVINFGEEEDNESKLAAFVDTVNGKDGTGSHLVTVPAGSMLHDSLMTSAIVVGEDGTGAPTGGGFEFGVDPNEDPELALALRVSMEEQRARQEADARANVGTSGTGESGIMDAPTGTSEEALLEAALRGVSADSAAQPVPETPVRAAEPDPGAMTEDEQIAYALQISMQAAAEGMDVDAVEPAKTEGTAATAEEEDEAMDEAFLESVLETIPGVDPQAAIALAKKEEEKKKKKDGEK